MIMLRSLKTLDLLNTYIRVQGLYLIVFINSLNIVSFLKNYQLPDNYVFIRKIIRVMKLKFHCVLDLFLNSVRNSLHVS